MEDDPRKKIIAGTFPPGPLIHCPVFRPGWFRQTASTTCYQSSPLSILPPLDAFPAQWYRTLQCKCEQCSTLFSIAVVLDPTCGTSSIRLHRANGTEHEQKSAEDGSTRTAKFATSRVHPNFLENIALSSTLEVLKPLKWLSRQAHQLLLGAQLPWEPPPPLQIPQQMGHLHRRRKERPVRATRPSG